MPCCSCHIQASLLVFQLVGLLACWLQLVGVVGVSALQALWFGEFLNPAWTFVLCKPRNCIANCGSILGVMYSQLGAGISIFRSSDLLDLISCSQRHQQYSWIFKYIFTVQIHMYNSTALLCSSIQYHMYLLPFKNILHTTHRASPLLHFMFWLLRCTL